MRNVLMLLCLLMMSATLARAEGGATGVGGGGDNTVFEFREMARTLFGHLIGQSKEVFGVDADVLAKTYADVKVESVETACIRLDANPCDPRDVRDAVNFPDLKLIRVSRGRWAQIKTDQRSAHRLVLHEYMGILGVERDTDEQSTRVIERLDQNASIMRGQSAHLGFNGQWELIAQAPGYCPKQITISSMQGWAVNPYDFMVMLAEPATLDGKCVTSKEFFLYVNRKWKMNSFNDSVCFESKEHGDQTYKASTDTYVNAAGNLIHRNKTEWTNCHFPFLSIFGTDKDTLDMTFRKIGENRLQLYREVTIHGKQNKWMANCLYERKWLLPVLRSCGEAERNAWKSPFLQSGTVWF